MSARLVFLGRLADLSGPLVVAPGPLAAVALPEGVLGPRVRLALNGVLVDAVGLVLADGDELAFLPPVSGG
ncbi:MAG: MoaD/ThiS family protein [Sphingomonadales bacterium]|nr:MoaD/ThiS family protein [Sphingomonadales bacterium]MDE2169651.1 MoaD/ThiS family protein [Sphingomonadales bacterium]